MHSEKLVEKMNIRTVHQIHQTVHIPLHFNYCFYQMPYVSLDYGVTVK